MHMLTIFFNSAVTTYKLPYLLPTKIIKTKNLKKKNSPVLTKHVVTCEDQIFAALALNSKEMLDSRF